ncbi:multiprotein-bridging factor 1 family protein [Kribbella sp. NPDC050124]|uniref:multiprotein-bridging factor 1 family protein n=1 Tax=Kribbella sp. NPDC050124 TaxID=3364114 RepID=UPI0037BCAAA6
MNDTLRRALFEAQLSEADLAARLGVDPKTAQRWLDGRLPYARYRDQLARLLGLDEGEIWPEVRAAGRSLPAEFAAAYPRRDLISQEAWLSMFAGAQSEINVLAYSAGFLVGDARFLGILADKGDQGQKVAVALGDPDRLDLTRAGSEEDDEEALSDSMAASIDRIRPLVASEQVQLRVHDVLLYNSIYRVDNQVLVNQHLHGIASARAPVYHLLNADQGEMFNFYLASFDRVWSDAMPAVR